MMKRYTLLAIAIAIIGLTTGCNRNSHVAISGPNVTRAEMVGTWQITYNPGGGKGVGKATLVLNVDGTFNQTFTPTGGKPLQNKGKWTYPTKTGEPFIELYDYVSYVEEGGRKLAKSPRKLNHLIVRTYWDDCEIWIKPDGFKFEKRR